MKKNNNKHAKVESVRERKRETERERAVMRNDNFRNGH